MNHYPHHVGDFNNATRHLTRVERSLYRDLIDLYYDTEAPLNGDFEKLSRRIICDEDDKSALRDVLNEFFVLQEDGYHNTRCNAEIAKYQGQIEQASRAGKASAAKRYGKNLTTVEQPFNQPEPEPEPEPEPLLEADASLSPAKLPPCPHDTLIDLFGQHLPSLPQPKKELWEGKNAESMRCRWKWVMTAKKKNGERYATNKAEAIGWLTKFFTHVERSDFLTGRNGKFLACDLGWLMKADNFAKVLQGNYDNRVAA